MTLKIVREEPLQNLFKAKENLLSHVLKMLGTWIKVSKNVIRNQANSIFAIAFCWLDFLLTSHIILTAGKPVEKALVSLPTVIAKI